MVCDPNGDGLKDYFDKAAFEFLMGLSLHMRYAEKNGSMEGMALFLGDPGWDSDKQMYEHMKQAVHDPEGKMGWTDSAGRKTVTHPVITMIACAVSDMTDLDRFRLITTARTILALYFDPIVANHTAHSDFLIRNLKRKPVILEFYVPFTEIPRLTPLYELLRSMILNHMPKTHMEEKEDSELFEGHSSLESRIIRERAWEFERSRFGRSVSAMNTESVNISEKWETAWIRALESSEVIVDELTRAGINVGDVFTKQAN
jgi:type IV secretory pathway TraG/TraD family ATPase VirD4